MDKMQEIAKFHALFQLAALRGIDLDREIQYQLALLDSIGVERNNEIHNRVARKQISIAYAEQVLMSVRQAAGIVGVPFRMQPPIRYEEPSQTREEAAAAYLRASGG
ncbi:hypothetical protein IGS59_08230 [Janthinobacterium sp. GW460P]|uniref:hypothetical protein n=1 Tax=unclassified Janthinobacterium TaxID=2610881 RepID=UPI000A329BAA|nr:MULTISPECIES: hypothetical protein [unclassified Janthinobacterium]MCC7702220.1 hypothetical protein [Janthinobacterium sp. GW460P]MCC7707728.1 hypothetical protein [Janthinobacterium sp. GW460W]